ncbi:MAG: hypothetical protein KY445_09395 [Armatimonadetes bacterium]|nr:hypothetical protein [Armatimonadota bacterium]
MAVALHLFWLFFILGALGLALWRFGRRPKNWWLVPLNVVPAAILAVVCFAVSVVGVREGTRSNLHVFLYFLGFWLLLSFIGSRKIAVIFSLIFAVMVFCHRIEYFNIAQSVYYTDNPKYRVQDLEEANFRLKSAGLPAAKRVRTRASWHTPLTRLFEVRYE